MEPEFVLMEQEFSFGSRHGTETGDDPVFDELYMYAASLREEIKKQNIANKFPIKMLYKDKIIDVYGFVGNPPFQVFAMYPERSVVIHGIQVFPMQWKYANMDEVKPLNFDPKVYKNAQEFASGNETDR